MTILDVLIIIVVVATVILMVTWSINLGKKEDKFVRDPHIAGDIEGDMSVISLDTQEGITYCNRCGLPVESTRHIPDPKSQFVTTHLCQGSRTIGDTSKTNKKGWGECRYCHLVFAVDTDGMLDPHGDRAVVQMPRGVTPEKP